MVTATLISSRQHIYIPRNGYDLQGAYLELSIKSTTDAVTLDVPVHFAEQIGNFVRLLISLPEGAFAGEWEYSLTSWDGAVSTGLLMIEDKTAEGATQYDESKTYKQYGE